MNQEQLESYNSPETEGFLTEKEVLAFKPNLKTFSMKCNIKGSGFKPKTLKFLVHAEDYGTAKVLTEIFVYQHINRKLHISSVIGNEIVYEYAIKEAILDQENLNEKTQ